MAHRSNDVPAKPQSGNPKSGAHGSTVPPNRGSSGCGQGSTKKLPKVLLA